MRSWEFQNQSGSEKTILLLCFYWVFELVADLLTLVWFFFCSCSLSQYKQVFLFFFASLNVCNYSILKNCVSVQMNMMRKLSKCSLWPKRYVFHLIKQENFTYSVDSDQSESQMSVSVYFDWSVPHLLLAPCADGDD